MESGRFHGHASILSGQLSFPKIAQSLESIILAGAARNHSTLTAILNLFYPVAPSARDNNEIAHVHLL